MIFLTIFQIINIQLLNLQQFNLLNMRSEGKPSSFICKFNALLKNKNYHEVIKFNQAEAKIYIFDKQELQSSVLPLYFRHNRFYSFTRQLNLYGFKKLKNQPVLCFTHPVLANREKILRIRYKKKSIQLMNEDEIHSNLADSNSINQSKKNNNQENQQQHQQNIFQQNDNQCLTFQIPTQSISPNLYANSMNFPVYGQQQIYGMQVPVLLSQTFYYPTMANLYYQRHSNL